LLFSLTWLVLPLLLPSLLLLLFFLLVPTHSLDQARPDIQQDRKPKAKQDEQHRLSKFINVLLSTMSTTHGTFEVIFWAKVTISLALSISAIAGPLNSTCQNQTTKVGKYLLR
jgi:hypothetical protein